MFPKSEKVDEALWDACWRVVPQCDTEREMPYYCGRVAEFRVFLVDGDEIKLKKRKKASHRGDDDYMDFVEGGNGVEDPDLCAEDEIFLDDRVDLEDLPFVCYHEATEARHMKRYMTNGMKGPAAYLKAHELANKQEKVLRERQR